MADGRQDEIKRRAYKEKGGISGGATGDHRIRSGGKATQLSLGEG